MPAVYFVVVSSEESVIGAARTCADSINHSGGKWKAKTIVTGKPMRPRAKSMLGHIVDGDILAFVGHGCDQYIGPTNDSDHDWAPGDINDLVADIPIPTGVDIQILACDTNLFASYCNNLIGGPPVCHGQEGNYNFQSSWRPPS